MKTNIDKGLEVILITLMATMLISVIWQVFSRFIIQSPSTLTDEISSFALIWVGLLGASYATGKKLHLAIDLLPEKLIAKNPKFYDRIIAVSIFCFGFCVMFIGGFRLCWLTFLFKQKSAALQIPLGYVYTVVPLSGLLICYYSGLNFLTKKNS